MTFGCQVTAQARPPRQQRSFFVQNRNRFAGLRFCFPDLTSYTLVSGKAEPAEITRFQRVFYVNCLSFAKRYSLLIAAQDLRGLLYAKQTTESDILLLILSLCGMIE